MTCLALSASQLVQGGLGGGARSVGLDELFCRIRRMAVGPFVVNRRGKDPGRHRGRGARFFTDLRAGTASTLEWTLDATAKTIRHWAEQGLMPQPYKLGKSLRWDAAELRRWIEGGCQPARQG